ncbi:MAG: hypothetical protein GTN89_12180 [Acidobacteria bacterium]|nr:hypothetical protein [Acidobacteriota bacterium]NIM63482.1 hypothetical protein [Acidobacteriota bacterium]NIO60910.1 hypothetical protein [Acidobacteriota bacterium]NIQ31102.1 hypothetical protein [Acidobacteriota bacterium]NIQ87371.1 hypothetical protein [Acidobacteriota bacterium]
MKRWTLLARLVFAGVCAVLAVGITAAQSTPDETRDVERPSLERRLGEEEQILKRNEWFFSSRTAGTSNADDRARLRREAVAQAKAALQQQSALRTEGMAETLNPWAPKGPTPSNFGGWAFGTVSGRATALAADWAGGILYFGSAAGGLWRSDNDGLTWTQLFEDVGTMAVAAIELDPADPNVIWVGTGDNVVSCESYFGLGLYRSTDGGVTWEERNGSGSNTLENLASFANVIVDPRNSDHLVVGGRIRQCNDGSGFHGGIYKSTDAGLNWTVQLASKQVYEIQQDPIVLDTFWAATDDGIYKSTDNAVSWTQQTANGIPGNNSGRCELAIAPSASATVYALFASVPNGQPSLWRTTDGGNTWEERTSGGAACDGQCWYNMVLRVKIDDPDTLYRGTIRSFKSTNGGQTFIDLTGGWGSQQKVHQDTHVFLMHPTEPDTYYTGTDGGLWKSINGGGSFTNKNGNMNTFLFYAVGVDAQNPERICGGAQDNSSVARTNNNLWSLQAVTGDGFTCHINPQDANYSYITSYPSGGYPNVWRSTTGLFGSYFDISDGDNGIIANDRSNWVTPYLLDPLNPNILYLGTHRIYRSDDHGSNWTQMGPDLTGNSGSLKNIGINRNFPDHVLTGSASGKVWRSTDGASTWTDITAGLPGRSINDVASDPLNPTRAFAVVGGFNTGHVWEWNEGAGWTDRSAGLPNVPHNTVLMISDAEIIIGNDIGVYRSSDGGLSWVPWMDGLPLGAVVTDLKYNISQAIVTAGTYGNGAWQASLGAVSPILLFDSASAPMEVNGNGDAHIDPGETWGVNVTLRNGGGATAVNPQGRLTTATPGVTLVDNGAVDFDDIFPGETGISPLMTEFIVEPDATCGDPLTFDFVEMNAANAPGPFQDISDAVSATIGTYTAPIPTTQVDDDFDPSPGLEWSHEDIKPDLSGCNGNPRFTDDWKVYLYDPSHENTYHAGRGVGSYYSQKNHAWLYYAGKDSAGGTGITIPADAISATLTFEHLYDTTLGEDGGLVAIDFMQDGVDNYTVIEPVGGYPGGLLASGNCNGLEGMPAYHGTSGWTTATFDLLPYKGNTVYLAFVFGSDLNTGAGTEDGWFIDDVLFVTEEAGPLVCSPTEWPGSVPQDVVFELTAPGMIEATWGDACNAGLLPGQQYAIHAGDLDLLASSGTYSHSPVDGLCIRSSPTTFAHGSGSEYYLVTPNDGSREGGAGTDSQGNPRPTTTDACGVQRIGTCN